MLVWFISDTHNRHWLLDVPKGIDMVICAGDVGVQRLPAINANEVLDFIDWFEGLPIEHKIWIPGNHDTSISAGLVRPENNKGCIFLNHEMVDIDGFKIFGSPYTPEFGFGWAYNVPIGKLHLYWDDIPNDLDILITHGPPMGVSDLVNGYKIKKDTTNNYCVGDEELMETVLRTRPKYHVFGHIHYNTQIVKRADSPTTFINAAVTEFNPAYHVTNNGFVLEI